MNFTKTTANLITEVYEILQEDSASSIYSESEITSRLNNIQNIIFRSYFVPFARKEKSFTTYKTTSVYEDTEAGAVSIKVTNDSGFPSSGEVRINGDVVSYTSIITGSEYDTLVGTDGVEADIKEGTKIYYLYPLSVDFGYKAAVYVDDTEYLYKQSLREFLRASRTFTSIFDEETQYLQIDTAEDQNLHIEYQKIPSQMSSSQDPSIPDEYTDVLVYGACVDVLLEKGDPDGLLQSMQLIYENKLVEMQSSLNGQFNRVQSIKFNA